MEYVRPGKRDRTADNFARATRRLMRRCDQINRRYGADVYLLVRRKYRYYEYNSANDPRFPRQPAELVRLGIRVACAC